MLPVGAGALVALSLVAQARRYCSSELVLALILVVEQNVVHRDERLEDKPVYYVGLNGNWGVAV